MSLICCVECARPWGVILDRGVEPTERVIAAARAEMIEVLREQWECGYEPDEMDGIDVARLPATTVTDVVYVTDALVRFAGEVGADPCVEAPCWNEVRWCDIPAWLLKGRKQRKAVRWDCCDLGGPEHYVAVPEGEK